MSKRRVVVTGMGAVTPIGNSTAEFWSGIRAGKVGIGPITAFDTTNYKVKLAAEVKDFDAKEHMDFKTAKRMERFSQFAVAAAGEAFRDSGLDMEKEDVFRAGVIIGSGVGSLQEVESAVDRIEKKGPSRVNPLLVPRMIGNMAKCFYSAGISGKMHQRGNGLRDRKPLHWRRIPGNPVWGRGYYGGRRRRELYLPYRSSRFYGVNSVV